MIGVSQRAGEARARLDRIPGRAQAAARRSRAGPRSPTMSKATLVALAQARHRRRRASITTSCCTRSCSRADPSGCSPDMLAEKYLDRKLSAAAEQQADCSLTLAERMIPDIDAARSPARSTTTIDLPLAGVLVAHGAERHPHRSRAAEASLRAHGRRDAAAVGARSTSWPASRSISTRRSNWARFCSKICNLPAPVKYGKGKTISTAADVLETLAAEHEIARKVLDYRQLSKLKGTYVDALPLLIDRVHRPRAHHLQPNRRGHRPALFIESESAEHPHPHRAGPRNPRRLRPARGLEAGGGRLLANRAAAAGAHVARSRCWSRPSATAKTSTPAPPPKCSARRP